MIIPSGPIIVVILVVNRDSKSELTIHSVYVHFLCTGNIHFIYSVPDAADCAHLVFKDDLEIVL